MLHKVCRASHRLAIVAGAVQNTNAETDRPPSGEGMHQKRGERTETSHAQCGVYTTRRHAPPAYALRPAATIEGDGGNREPTSGGGPKRGKGPSRSPSSRSRAHCATGQRR
jgi:hypothetical protein